MVSKCRLAGGIHGMYVVGIGRDGYSMPTPTNLSYLFTSKDAKDTAASSTLVRKRCVQSALVENGDGALVCHRCVLCVLCRLKQGKPVSDLLHASVEKFIREHGLVS